MTPRDLFETSEFQALFAGASIHPDVKLVLARLAVFVRKPQLAGGTTPPEKAVEFNAPPFDLAGKQLQDLVRAAPPGSFTRIKETLSSKAEEPKPESEASKVLSLMEQYRDTILSNAYAGVDMRDIATQIKKRVLHIVQDLEKRKKLGDELSRSTIEDYHNDLVTERKRADVNAALVGQKQADLTKVLSDYHNLITFLRDVHEAEADERDDESPIRDLVAHWRDLLKRSRQFGRATVVERDNYQVKAAKLQEFKDFVHKRLDEYGVPADPEPEQTAKHGCRIEGRLAWLRNRRAVVLG